MFRSANQRAQDEGDTGANEAARIRARESAVATAWRSVAWEQGEAACTLAAVAHAAGLPEAFVALVCERRGYALR